MLKLKVRLVDIETGGKNVALVNKEDAAELGIHTTDRVNIERDGRKQIFIVEVTKNMMRPGEIGLLDNPFDNEEELAGKTVAVEPTKTPRSSGYIKRRLLGERLNPEEITEIIKDVVENRLSDIEAVFFMASCYSNEFSEEELSSLAEAMVSAGKVLSFPGKNVVSKHCIGGVPGNRTTMLVVPIVAAAGLTIPKTSARAISSPAGTADVMEVLCSVEHPIEKVEEIVNKVGGCIIWNGAVNLSPADDKLNQLRYPLRLDPRPFLLASILSKKKAEGAKKVLIDIPVARGGKVETEEEGRKLASQFISLGVKLGLEVEVVLTAGDHPIGTGIGPALEACDVLKVLEKTDDAPLDLKQKAINLAGLLLEMAGKAERGTGEKLATEILDSGKALAKFQEIVKEQGGKAGVSSSDVTFGKYREKIFADSDCAVFGFNNSQITKIARSAGAPKNKGAGILLSVKRGTKVRKGEPFYEIHSEQKDKLDFAVSLAREDNGIVMEKSVLGLVSTSD
jgi:AMP phosphorylase